jgi:hypothetical protein
MYIAEPNWLGTPECPGRISSERPDFLSGCNDPLKSCSGVTFPREHPDEHRDGRRNQTLDGPPEVVASLLGMNKNTVQRIFQLKGWQVRKRPTVNVRAKPQNSI